MSFFSRLIKPYEATYSDDEFLEYSLRFIDAYHFADKTYPDTLTNTSRCLYAANYAALFHLIQGRSFTFGDDLCLQVARSFIYASLLAQDLKKPLSLDLLLGSPSQIYTYSTELIMRAWTVSPSHAISLKVFSACKDYITDRPRFQEISGEIITRARIDPDSALAAPVVTNFYGYEWADVMSTIRDSHFAGNQWRSVEAFTEDMATGKTIAKKESISLL